MASPLAAEEEGHSHRRRGEPLHRHLPLPRRLGSLSTVEAVGVEERGHRHKEQPRRHRRQVDRQVGVDSHSAVVRHNKGGRGRDSKRRQRRLRGRGELRARASLRSMATAVEPGQPLRLPPQRARRLGSRSVPVAMVVAQPGKDKGDRVGSKVGSSRRRRAHSQGVDRATDLPQGAALAVGLVGGMRGMHPVMAVVQVDLDKGGRDKGDRDRGGRVKGSRRQRRPRVLSAVARLRKERRKAAPGGVSGGAALVETKPS